MNFSWVCKEHLEMPLPHVRNDCSVIRVCSPLLSSSDQQQHWMGVGRGKGGRGREGDGEEEEGERKKRGVGEAGVHSPCGGNISPREGGQL